MLTTGIADMADRIASLQQEYMANKPWYVHSATRNSAEDILYSQGKVTADSLHCTKEKKILFFFFFSLPFFFFAVRSRGRLWAT